jgi:hypothetical protein
MKKLIVSLVLVATVLVLPELSEACCRWRHRAYPVQYVVQWQVPCPAPVPAVPAVPAVEQFVSPKGRVYRISVSREPEYEFERRAALPPDVAAPGPDDYIGQDRGKAKTSIAAGPHKTYDTLGDLLDDVVGHASDDFMRNRHEPRLSTDTSFDRVSEEDRNVTVPVWLYAIKKEANDNDYHLITGSDPAVGPVRYMNMEITGLPLGGPNRAKLRVPRDALKQFLRDHQDRVTTTGYFRFEDPVPVRITGSLFYDIDHKPGVVGSFTEPRRVPATAWEVHPVTEIVFEP